MNDPFDDPDWPQPRPAAVRLAECVATFREWLHMPDAGALYTVLATVAANRAPGDPVWLLVVGPPGGGKTETINAIASQPDVFPVATLTEGALLSGVAKRERAATAKGGLLLEIGEFGILLHKDFGSVLSMNRDSRAAVLAALREIYDGAWTRYVGTDGGRTLSWTGKIGLIAGCTPAIDSHHAVIGSMGERFVLYRLPATEADVQSRRAMAHVGHEKAMRQELAVAASAVLATVDTARLVAAPDEETIDRLVMIAGLAVRCRSAVERESYTHEITLIPEAEAPARLALVLLRLLNAFIAIGVDDEEAWRLVRKCALDSMPATRRSAIEDLIGRPDSSTTTEIAERTTYPTTTTRRTLEDLAAHGIVVRQTQGPGRADRWAVSEFTRGRWPTVPQMSDKTCDEHENGAGPVPISLPLHIDDDKRGTLHVEDVEDDYPRSAYDPAWPA